MEINSKIERNIAEWELCADKSKQAINSRNYRQFRKSIRDGQRTFDKIQLYLTDRAISHLDVILKDKLRQVAKKWKLIISGISNWRSDLLKIIENKKKSRKNDKCLSTNYRYGQTKPGKSVRIKAK